MSINDNLVDLAQAIRGPKLKKLSLPLNGIENEFCEYFTQILPCQTLEELNLGGNWFGTAGMSRFLTTFRNMQKLRVLNLGNIRLNTEE